MYHQLVSLITTFPCGKTTCFLRTATGPPTEHRKRETHATSHGSLSPRSFLVFRCFRSRGELTRGGKKNYALYDGRDAERSTRRGDFIPTRGEATKGEGRNRIWDGDEWPGARQISIGYYGV